MKPFNRSLLVVSLMGALWRTDAMAAEALIDSGSSGTDGALIYYAPVPDDVNDDRIMAYDAAREVVVRYQADKGVTYLFDGSRWLPKETAHSPGPRVGTALAYDPQRQVVVMFGGVDSDGLRNNDVWEFNGVDWTQKSGAAGPVGRSEPSMVYDGARKQLLVIGGHDGTSDRNDMWAWNGTSWTAVIPTTTNLPASNDHCMAYDESRGLVVAVLGAYTYEWNGSDWSARGAPGSYPSIADDPIIYDPKLQKIVAFDATTVKYWNGSTWEQISSGNPNMTNDPAVYDAARGKVLLTDGIYTYYWDEANGFKRPSDSNPVMYFDMTSRADGTFNFTTIDIPVGVEVRFKGNANNTPVVWLASDDVTISGAINLNGQDYNGSGTAPMPGNEPVPGPGGGHGGLGGRRFSVSGSYAAQPGEGIGGGAPGVTNGQGGGHAAHANKSTNTSYGRTVAMNGTTYGNRLVRPVLGGSGGGGSASTDTSDGYNGGAGGGAILIASNTQITLNGSITANGGGGSGPSGNGSGGSIRLVAGRIAGGGTLRADSFGRIRTEAFYQAGNLNMYASSGSITGSMQPTTLTDDQAPKLASIAITTVDGQAVAAPPQGDLGEVDVVFNNGGEVAIGLSAPQLPTGTVIDVRIMSAGGLSVVQSSPTDASGNATATATIPAGLGKLQAFATYVPPAAP